MIVLTATLRLFLLRSTADVLTALPFIKLDIKAIRSTKGFGTLCHSTHNDPKSTPSPPETLKFITTSNIMLKLSISHILGAVAIFACAAGGVASAGARTPLEARHVDASPTVSVCHTDLANFPATRCATISVVSDDCINFAGELSFLNKQISSAVVPDGLACTFFAKSDCRVAQNAVDVVLSGGSHDFSSVQGPAGTVNFNDQPSSFSCSPA